VREIKIPTTIIFENPSFRIEILKQKFLKYIDPTQEKTLSHETNPASSDMETNPILCHANSFYLPPTNIYDKTHCNKRD
jgi:hypothetical protein